MGAPALIWFSFYRYWQGICLNHSWYSTRAAFSLAIGLIAGLAAFH